MSDTATAPSTTSPGVSSAAGLVLAAGAGRRMGRPKALVTGPDGVPWVARTAELLRSAGARPVLVALGAAARESGARVPPWAQTLVVEGWQEGIGASLRESLTALDTRTEATAALIMLVDLPEARVAAARRVLGDTWDASTLRRAVYRAEPGHPVLIGRAHWKPLVARLEGDTGAQGYLVAHGVESVDCTDLGGGEDIDE